MVTIQMLVCIVKPVKSTPFSSKRKENKCGGYIFPRIQGEIINCSRLIHPHCLVFIYLRECMFHVDCLGVVDISQAN